MANYLISPQLEDKIQRSWLTEKYPELSKKPYLWGLLQDQLDAEILDNPYGLSSSTQQYVFRLLDQTLYWNFQTRWDATDLLWDPVFQNYNSKEADIYDKWLWTWCFLPDPDDEDMEFDTAELWKWDQYGFSSQLEMVMSLSAYRSREILKQKENQYEWRNSQWIRSIITACVHGDPKFYQYDENFSDRVISPFWNEVWFKPQKLVGKMWMVHHSHEIGFFSTFLRYAYECGYMRNIMWENGTRFIEASQDLPSFTGFFWDAGHSSFYDFWDSLFRMCTPIWWSKSMRNVHTHSFASIYRGKDQEGKSFYEFQIGENQELQLYNHVTESIDITFYPEDCEHLLKGILHQCAHWHGRTMKEQMLGIIEFIYSDAFTQKALEIGIPQEDIPQL